MSDIMNAAAAIEEYLIGLRRWFHCNPELSSAEENTVARIAQELEFGVVKEETVRELCAVIARMKEEEYIDAVILGCTELPLALNDEVSPVPCLDTLRVHADALIAWITGEKNA